MKIVKFLSCFILSVAILFFISLCLLGFTNNDVKIGDNLIVLNEHKDIDLYFVNPSDDYEINDEVIIIYDDYKIYSEIIDINNDLYSVSFIDNDSYYLIGLDKEDILGKVIININEGKLFLNWFSDKGVYLFGSISVIYFLIVIVVNKKEGIRYEDKKII